MCLAIVMIVRQVFILNADDPLQIKIIMYSAVMVAINIGFLQIISTLTPLGRKILDEIEGFKMYLGVAEEQRLKTLYPPDVTPEIFEKFLPYAIALDLENEWGDKFSRYIARSNMTYTPYWYNGTQFNAGKIGSFGSSISEGIASSVGTSNSSSGSGGGGGAGGGGGGGGGGGW